MPTAHHYRITGRVQGVGFRAATCDTARALGLSGWVRNCEDGRVELVAAGEAAAIERLRQWLSRGPASAEVAEVSEHSVEARDLPAPFRIA